MTTLLTPLDSTEAEYIELGEASGVFWKQIIPMNHEINYNGRNIVFTKEKLDSVKEAFNNNVTGNQTAFQLANDDNEHDTEEDKLAGRFFDPQRYRGEVTKFAVNSRGLFGKFNLTAEGAKLIQSNPKLSVSASLRENFEYDGKIYPMVCRHVLGTLDARIKGMSPWQKDDIGLNNKEENEEVLDFTMPQEDDDKTKNGETITVPKEDWDKVLAFMNDTKEENDALAELLNDNTDEPDETDEVVEELINQSTEITRDPKVIQLANNYANERFERLADGWRREGVPNPMIELARPVIASGDEFEINLSNGSKVDTKEVIASILNEAKGLIDMSAQATHQGKSKDDEDEENEAIKALDNYLAGF